MGAAHEASAPWGGTRAAGREAQAVRGSEGACAGREAQLRSMGNDSRRGAKRIAQLWTTIRAAG